MAGATLTTLNELTQEIYVPGLKDFVNRSRPLWARIGQETDKKKFKAREFLWAAQIQDNQSFIGLAEGETLPVAGNVSVVNMTLGIKYHYEVVRITAQAAKLVTGDPGAFKSSVKTELDSARDSMIENLHKHSLYGTGAGDFGQVSGYTGTTLSLYGDTTVGGVGSRFLRRGMNLSSYTALSGGSQGADYKAVSNIPSSTTATVPSGAGFVTGDYVFASRAAGVDSRGLVTQGLGGILDDGSRVGTIQGLSRTTYPELKANVLGNSGTLRAWSPELMDNLGTEASQNGGGGFPSAFYSRIEIQKRAASYLWQDRRAVMSDMKLEGGWDAVVWHIPGKGATPWLEDRYCRPHEVLAPHEEDLFWAIDEDTQFEDGDGGMWRFTDRTHVYEAWLFTWRQLGSWRFNRHSTLRDISHYL